MKKLIIAVLLSLVSEFYAADRYWVGNGNWNNSANWSTTSGGSGGASVPGTSDRAIFDANSTNAIINANVDVGSLLLTNWNGTITVQDAYTVQIRSSFNQYSGTITCGTNRFTFYQGSSSAMTCNFAGGTFTANPSGWVRFHNAGYQLGHSIIGNPVLENVSFYTSGGGGTYPWIISAGSTVTVNRAIVFEGGGYNQIKSGSILALGNITNLNHTQGSGTIFINGSSNQRIYAPASAMAFPNIVVKKNSGVLNLEGTIKIEREWTHLQGDINPGSSEVIFVFRGSPYGSISSTTGRATFNKLTFHQETGGGTAWHFYLLGNITLVVSNTLSIGTATSYGGGTLHDGSIEALSNIDIRQDYSQSTTTLYIKGQGNQIMTGTGASALPPYTVINKPSGRLSLAGTFALRRSWTHLSGEVDPGTSYVWAYAYSTGSGRIITITSAVGRVNFYDFRIDQTAGGGTAYYIDIADGTTMVITNRLMFDPTSGFQIRKGLIEVHGDIINEASSVFGTTPIVIAGANDHAISTLSPFNQLGFDMEVNKSGGIFTLATPLIFNTANKDFTLKAGIFNLSTNKFTLSAAGADFRMTNNATLMVKVDSNTNGMIAVTGSGIARIDGNLYIYADKGFRPDPNKTNVIITASSGPIQNTPFDQELVAPNYTYKTYYNSGGNRVFITKFRFSPSGTIFMLQ